MKNRLIWILLWVLLGIMIFCLVGGIITTIYCFITYGNLSVEEIPTWALWFMFRR